jgi:hypothetical protein
MKKKFAQFSIRLTVFISLFFKQNAVIFIPFCYSFLYIVDYQKKYFLKNNKFFLVRGKKPITFVTKKGELISQFF